MDKTQFINTLKVTREEWDELLAQIGETRMEQSGATGKWSVKDVIAHVAWCEREMVPVMRTHVLAGSELWDLSDYESNEIVYQRNRDRSLHEIMSDEQQAYTNLLEAAQTLNDEDLNDAHRFKHMPQDWIPWQLFAGNSFDHYRDHMTSLSEWLAQ
ncbi:MAG: maleylpyruvate isomerase N-terminal domain-containing protein [Ktedonobacteraceae bacterium]